MVLVSGLFVIVAAVYAVIRKVDVRLALLLASLVLGLLAGQPSAVLQKFLTTFSDEKYVVPICTAMGFAYVLRHTRCDAHLVELLCRPLRRVRMLVIPGAVLVGFVVNIPIISQTSTAVAIGSVLIPLMSAAGISAVTSGAALMLGASIGGELLNPGAPEYGTVVSELNALSAMPITRATLVGHSLPLVILHLTVATSVFWWLSVRQEARQRQSTLGAASPEVSSLPTVSWEDNDASFRINAFKAIVPLVPLLLLFLTSRAFNVIELPESWLVGARELADLPDTAASKKASELFDSRLIGAAMLIGVVCAAATMLFNGADRKASLGTARAFFDGAGYAFAEIIAIIVAAACFAEGVKLIGIGDLIGALIRAVPALLVPAAGLCPWALATVSGSGMAATQGTFAFFAAPALAQNIDPAYIGSIVSLSAAAGRTMSPVAAVVLMAAKMTGTDPIDLVKRVAPPLLIGLLCTLLFGALMAPRL